MKKDFDPLSPKVWARGIVIAALLMFTVTCFYAFAKDIGQALAIIVAGGLIAMAILERQDKVV